jgi:predicted nucleic acid-binding protein
VSECVLDTDVVIAALDRGDSHHSAAARALRRMAGDGTRMLLPLVNYAELLVRPAADAGTLRAAVDAIDALRIELVAPTPPIARDVARLRSSGVSMPDAFALATALARRASLATFDRAVRQAARAAGAELTVEMR